MAASSVAPNLSDFADAASVTDAVVDSRAFLDGVRVRDDESWREPAAKDLVALALGVPFAEPPPAAFLLGEALLGLVAAATMVLEPAGEAEAVFLGLLVLGHDSLVWVVVDPLDTT